MNLNDSISNIGEKELVKIITTKVKNNFLGDDAAVVDNNFNNLIASSDMLIQSHHLPKEMTYFQMGFKIVTVNVSDIIAMGATPKYFLLNIAVFKDLKISQFNEIIDGVISACEYYNIQLIGGDTDEASEIILSGTILGYIDKNKEILKYGFRDGDLLCLTGPLGLSALGFKLLDTDLNGEDVDFFKSKILNPIARVKEGEILKDFATSCTDITDGLSEELYEMLDANNLNSNLESGFNVYEDKLPLSSDFIGLVDKLNLDVFDLFFNFGEDFELVFTIPSDCRDELSSLFDFYVIGEVTGSNGVNFVKSSGSVDVLSRKGYTHLI